MKVLHCMYAKLKLFLNASPSKINLPHTPYLPLFISHSLHPCRKKVHINCESAHWKETKLIDAREYQNHLPQVLPFSKFMNLCLNFQVFSFLLFQVSKETGWDGCCTWTFIVLHQLYYVQYVCARSQESKLWKLNEKKCFSFSKHVHSSTS